MGAQIWVPHTSYLTYSTLQQILIPKYRVLQAAIYRSFGGAIKAMWKNKVYCKFYFPFGLIMHLLVHYKKSMKKHFFYFFPLSFPLCQALRPRRHSFRCRYWSALGELRVCYLGFECQDKGIPVDLRSLVEEHPVMPFKIRVLRVQSWALKSCTKLMDI